jgi:hypothetical protein
VPVVNCGSGPAGTGQPHREITVGAEKRSRGDRQAILARKKCLKLVSGNRLALRITAFSVVSTCDGGLLDAPPTDVALRDRATTQATHISSLWPGFDLTIGPISPVPNCHSV